MPSSVRSVAIDTGVFVALLTSKDSYHQSCLDALKKLPEITRFFTTESCIVESTFLLPDDVSLHRNFVQLIKALQIQIVPIDCAGLERAFDLMDKYIDLPMDFADASLVLACEGLDIRHVLTLDRRDFSIYKPKHCVRFQLLPAD